MDEIDEIDEITKPQLRRRKWVEDYNNSLPQQSWYCGEFECEIITGIGGIYDSEYMNFVFDGIQSRRIKRIKRQQSKIKNTK